MAADFLFALLVANIAASAAIGLVLLVRGPCRRLAGARVAAWLWLTPVLAGVAVLLPPLPTHVAPVAVPIRPMVETAFDTAANWIAPDLPTAHATAANPITIDFTLVLAAFWALGALGFLALLLRRQQRGMDEFGRLTRGPDGVWSASGHAGPAVIGLFRPRLVAPADFERRFTPREQDLVLAHERAHLSAGHTRINAGLALLSCINWFNPLIHLGVRYARTDQELACDAAVVEQFPGERRIYAEALLKTQLAPASLPLGCTWPSRSSSLLKERVMMLASKPPSRRTRIAGAALVSALTIAFAVASWAQTPASPLTNGSPMIAPGNPRTMTDEQARKTLQRLREPDGGPPGVAPADLQMLRAQLEARFKNGQRPVPVTAPLDREALLKAVQNETSAAPIANATFSCDVWGDKFTNVNSLDVSKFNNEAAVLLSLDKNSYPVVMLPTDAFPAEAFPAHGKITSDSRYIDTSSIVYRLMSSKLIDSLNFADLDKQVARLTWERIKLTDHGPEEAFVTGYCRRTNSPPRQDGGTAKSRP